MYISRKTDGTLEYIESLDEKNPDPELLRNVEEIYVISKVLVPVMTLKPKPRDESTQTPVDGKTAATDKEVKKKPSKAKSK